VILSPDGFVVDTKLASKAGGSGRQLRADPTTCQVTESLPVVSVAA
jgi:hypothetical protein